MDTNIKEHISKISIETDKINIKDIQGMLKIMEKIRNSIECKDEYIKYTHEILDILWKHMETGFVQFDDQLLCSTSFYALLPYSNEKEYYLNKVLKLIHYELDLKQKSMDNSKDIVNTISLSYGIFQSSILQQNHEQPILVSVLENIFALLTLMAYEYSQYTFITFKIMTLFKKVKGTVYEIVIFNKDHNLRLLDLINHNWENPITGVRSLNKIIFHNLIAVVDDSMYEFTERKLSGFYWCKAKYLMFAEIIENCSSNIKLLLDKYDLVDGLVYSLNKAGLVSAGADMYVAILNKLITEEEWCAIFLSSLTKLIKGSSKRSIENFVNYWCLNTLKKFPSLSQTMFEQIHNLDSSDYKLYSCLCVIQQSNRLGLLEKYSINSSLLQELVLNNLNHSDVHIRIVSFNIMCGGYKFLPDQIKYNLILDFLKNNVNSDSSILRISMIKSFNNFLVELHLTYVHSIRNAMASDINNLRTFCKDLQTFIIESINYNGNYQRKIATIKITKSMFDIFKEIPRKKLKGTREPEISLLDFIKSADEWFLSDKQVIMKFISLLKDPSDDIREHVSEVLLNNYCEQICKSDVITYLTEEALSCMRSRFFYQISCGHTMFKLIIHILLKENCTEGIFKNVEQIFGFGYNELKSECTSQFDIVKSIVEGKQLYSCLNILRTIFEVSFEKSYQLNIPIHTINSLIELLINISSQFAWEQENTTSSDFSKMNDMVQTLIESSEYKIGQEFHETDISGLHQIVLNSLWLNVKASCELSSILIKYYKADNFQDISEKCLKIICNVLETSRHKGAIEAAGAALGETINQLTSLPSDSTISKLPLLLLKKKLKQLVVETNNMASVTRRGAGLSIMIHRIVSSDMKKGKPLFHYFMQILLETCNKLPEYCTTEDDLDKDNEKDLPQAIYIHFLTKIVIDSSLASDMMYYSDKLAKLAFDNLSSSCWQIRNAALQLYGSLIPKLIGQKKNSGANEEVIATVAVDEFRTHSPKLWKYIEKQLKLSTESHCDIVQCHNNLVPILSVLANLAPFYSFNDEMESKDNLLPSLISLLGSPIYVIRQLASKCILNIYPLEVILETLFNYKCGTENSLHGTLVLLNLCNKQYNVKCKDEIGHILQNKFNLLMHRCSYLSREIFERTFSECINLTEEMVKGTLSEMSTNAISPGIFLWGNFRIKLCLEKTSWSTIPQIVTLILDCSNFETYCETLCKRIEVERMIDEQILLKLSSLLYTLGFKRKSGIIWKTLYEISLHSQSLSNHLDCSLIYQYLSANEVVYSMRYMIVLAAKLFQVNEELLLLSNIIFNLCYPETDIDMRLIAATANNELAFKFGSLSDCIKINAIKAAVMFLQDEDEDVRNLSVHFYRYVSMEEIATQPYICWRKILCNKFLYKVFHNPHNGIQSVYKDLMNLLKSLQIHNEDQYNPFANDSKNVYLEQEILKQVLCDLIDIKIE